MSNQIQGFDRVERVTSPTAPNTPVGRILVVDDEPLLKTVLVESLQKRGYEVTGCGSGRAALTELRARNYDLLLTDLMMPEMDGITLLKAALDVDAHLVGIIVTGQGTIQTAVDAMQKGAFDYVLKPFRMQTLMPVLTRAMNVRHLKLENVELRETLAIYGLCQTIGFTLDPQTVLSKLADAALQQSDADEVSVLIPTSDGTELYVAAVRGSKRERLLGERIPFEQSIASWVGRERTAVILNGEVHDERFVALWPRADIKSAISVPMQVANKLVGIINLNVTSRLRPFTLGQMKALTILGSTAAAALESASLYTQVQATEAKYRSIFENATEGLFQSNAQGHVLTANPALARILGYDSPEQMMASVTNIAKQIYVDPEARIAAARLQEINGNLMGFEMEAYRKDKEKIWVSMNRRSVRDQNGEVLYLEGSIENITERKRAEEEKAQLSSEIESQRQRLNNIVASVPGVVWEAWGEPDAANQRIDFVSDYVETMLGYSVAEWISTPNFWLTIVHPEDEERVARIARNAFKNGKGTTMEFRWLANDGREVWVESNFAVVMDEQGQAVGLRGVNTDITERKQAEKDLRESEERYRDLVENAHDLIYEHDLQGNFTSSNKAGERITGYSLEETLALNLAQTLAPADLEKARSMTQRKLAGEKVTAYDLELIGKDGQHVAVEVNTRLVLKDGVPVGVQGIARDITERKLAERALRESEARKRAILESAMECIITMDSKGLIVDWNPAAEKTFGYSQAEAVGKPMLPLIIPEHLRGRHSHGLDHYLESDVVHVIGQRMELSAKRREGSEFPIELTITRIELDGAPMFTGYLRDITDRKKAEGRLAAQYAVTRALAESNTINEGAPKILQAVCDSLGWEYGSLWTVDRSANVLRCSETWQSLGAGANEFEKVSCDFVFPPGVGLPGTVWQEEKPGWIADVVADPDFPRFPNAAKVGLHGACAFPIRFRSEILGVVEFLSRSIREPDPDLLAMMVTVGSQIGQFIERKRVEGALGDSEEQLRQSQKLEAIGQLAGGVAHDFNNLLTAINGYSSLALQRLDDKHPIRGYLEEVKKAGDRAANLTRQLLAFGRKQMLQPVALNLNDVVADMSKMLRRLIGEDIQFTAKFDPELMRTKADPGQIEQVLVNLVVNARDAMPQGGHLTIETANIEVDREYASKHFGVQPGSYVMLAVSDTGIGMDEDTKARIFEPFYTTKEKGKGTGLGLSTVYGIIKQSGGNIWVYSEPGRGTSFKVYLQPFEAAPGATEKATVEPAAQGGSETILLVEDEDIVRGLARKILEQSGYRVLDARNGTEAIRISREHGKAIQLLLTDVVMPEISGKEIAERLTVLHPTIRVLFMSGYTDEAIVHHGVIDANVEFIQKPFTPMALARKVRAVLDLKPESNGKKK